MNKQLSFAGEHYSSVCPYLMVESVEKQLDFLMVVFNAEIKEQLKSEDGIIQHGEVTIGDTVIMIGKSRDAWPASVGANYVFVESTDQVYTRAIRYGASSIMEPGDRFYGIREGGVKDAQGNTWWIAQMIEKLSEDEMQARLLKNQKK